MWRRPAWLAVSILWLTACRSSTPPPEPVRPARAAAEPAESAKGREMLALLLARDGLTDDARLLRYVNLVGRTVSGSGFRFAVTRSDVPYARSFPGRFVAVSRGLLFLVRSEAELAMVLARESCRFSAGASPEPEDADPVGEARRDACAGERVSKAGYDAGAFLRLLSALQERAISTREKADLQFRIERFKSLPESTRGGQKLSERYRSYAIL